METGKLPASTHYACREIAEKLAAAKARIAELEEAFTWSMHNWGTQMPHTASLSLFLIVAATETLVTVLHTGKALAAPPPCSITRSDQECSQL